MSDDKYLQRGVSSGKEEVHDAVRKLAASEFSRAFCRVESDPSDSSRYLVLHADGAGTKSALAYAYWKETGNLDVWQGIATDAMVMNTDDMLCVGADNHIFVSSTIGRNKNLIPGKVIAAIIDGNMRFVEKMKKYGIDIHLSGGETADVGDLVRTIIVDATALGFVGKNRFISNNHIAAGDVVVGLSSSGQCEWEDSYNSGIGSNGLTSARHDMFSKIVAQKYPETFDASIENVAYIGKYKLTDVSPVKGIDMGSLVLSPTRTYLPLMKEVFEQMEGKIHGLVHCTGGGQFKTLKFINQLRVVKDNLFPIPPVFDLIMKSGTFPEEMYRTFNMGHRLEIFVNEKDAPAIISMAKNKGIDAQIIGYCLPSEVNAVELETPFGKFVKEEK
jgi:phosphoribosylformylglycinamidine cyclo-ligase